MWVIHQSVTHNCQSLLYAIIILFNILLCLHGVALNFEERFLRDSEMLKVLASLKGIPKNMTKHELSEIRKNIPKVVENWISFINNEQLLLDYTYGKISRHAFDDLQKSTSFLRIVPCKISTGKRFKLCFTFHPSSIIPKHAIQLATLSTYIHSWINPNKLKLRVFLMNPDHKIYEHFDINLNNNNTIENKVEFSSIKSLHRQVTWDISLMLRNLQQSKYHLITLVIMTLENQENDTPNDGSNSDDVDFSDQLISYAVDTNDDGTTQNVPTDGYNELDQVFKIANISNDEDGGDNDNIEVFDGGSELFFIQKSNLRLPRILNIDDDILHQNTQIILNTKTAEIMQLERNYLPKKRLAPRSFLGESVKYSSQPQSCPSFLDRNHRETKCCLFRYTLNKLQMDQNDKLRFIIFPHHLPMNMCHGRCIGLYMPTDNAHSILMNRYFSGLGSAEREAIYNSMPCCAANETIPFTILYKNHKEQLVTETLPRAVKTNCACS